MRKSLYLMRVVIGGKKNHYSVKFSILIWRGKVYIAHAFLDYLNYMIHGQCQAWLVYIVHWSDYCNIEIKQIIIFMLTLRRGWSDSDVLYFVLRFYCLFESSFWCKGIDLNRLEHFASYLKDLQPAAAPWPSGSGRLSSEFLCER